MKKGILLILGILIIFSIVSAGCLSFSSTTADIVIGDQKVGTVTITPHNDKLYTDSSVSEKFDIEIDVFGVKYSKEGLTLSEKNELLSTIAKGNLKDLNLDDYTEKSVSTESILDSIANIKLSAENQTTLSEALGNAGKSFRERLEAFEKIIESN